MFRADIYHEFDNFTLDAQFEVPAGITVLFGRSGSGKSTIVRALAGLLSPQRGRIEQDGRLLLDTAAGVNIPAHKRQIGYVFQEPRLFPHMKVRRNLTYGRLFGRGVTAGADFHKVVDMLGIEHLLDRRPTFLSGGEKQRVAIGRALLSGAQMILADEPLSALDEARKNEVLPYFERLRDELNIPIVYVSHSPSEVARIATTVLVIENGRVVASGDARDVLSDPTVTPLGARSAGAVIDAVVMQHHADGLSTLNAGPANILVPKVHRDIGTGVRLRIEAQDVMISLSEPQGISALNVIPVTVKELRRGTGPGVLVQMTFGSNKILSRVTRRSADALGLAAGQQVYAVLKAVSIARESTAR